MSVVSIGTSNINMGNQGGLGGTSQLSNLWGGTSSVSLNNIWTAKVYARKTGQSNFGYFYNNGDVSFGRLDHIDYPSKIYWW